VVFKEAVGAGVKQIEQFFAERSGGEFGINSRAYPYRVIGPKVGNSHVVFATKWQCLFRGLDEYGPPKGVGMIFRYGLIVEDDLPWIRNIAGPRVLLFLGDLDPTDLLIFAWLRANLSPKTVIHFGVNDSMLNELHVTVPDSYTIALSGPECEALSLLDEVCPDVDEIVGSECIKLLRSGRKVEQEAVVSALGSQSPILKLISQRVRVRDSRCIDNPFAL